jgi:flavin reductase (DIM6/NTAB) family NADH-FMN oxidoreductase RutF/rubredoxin
MYDKILTSLSYGMYAIGSKGVNAPNACISNTVVQISSYPMTIAVSINHSNFTNDCIKQSKEFTVSVLSENTSGAVIGALGFTSGRDGKKLHNVKHKVLREGAPVIQEDICCWFLCKVVNTVETVTHTIFIAEPVAGSETIKGKPMTYDFYLNVIKGKAPKFAPTYIPEEEEVVNKYACTICNYEYKSSLSPFEELPDSWICPICGAPKSVFRKKD